MTEIEPDLDLSPEFTERRRLRGWHRMPRLCVVLYVIAFVATEAIGAYGSIPVQACLDAFGAFVAINHAVFGYRTRRTAGTVMAALFVTRLITLSLPTAELSLSTRTAIVGIASCGIAYLATWVLSKNVEEGRTPEGMPLKRPLVSRLFTIVITVLSGIPIGWLAFHILKPRPLAIDPVLHSTSLPLLAAGCGLAVGALGEELLYRRLVAAMVQHTAHSQTPWISAFLFGATYLGSQSLAMTALTFFSGGLFAWSCERTGSIRPVVAAHIIASILAFIVLP